MVTSRLATIAARLLCKSSTPKSVRSLAGHILALRRWYPIYNLYAFSVSVA